MSTSGHLYKERLAPRDIRVISLQPGSSSSPVRCDITKVNLDKGLAFHALSYVWGDPKGPRLIEVGSVQVPVTSNLYTALHHLRHPTDALVLWVDAICINQADMNERNAQVMMMGEIYSVATTVFSWIGEADKDSDVAFDIMTDISESGSSSQAAQAASSFYLSLDERPWFGRVWILQEMAQATHDPIVVCGFKQASWSAFISARKIIATSLFSEIGMVRPKAVDSDCSTGEVQRVEVLAKLKIDVLDDMRLLFARNAARACVSFC